MTSQPQLVMPRIPLFLDDPGHWIPTENLVGAALILAKRGLTFTSTSPIHRRCDHGYIIYAFACRCIQHRRFTLFSFISGLYCVPPTSGEALHNRDILGASTSSINAQVFNWFLARGQGHSTLTPLTGVRLLLPQNLMDLKNERFLAQEFKNELVGASVGMG